MRLFVTGSTGFIGSHFVRAALASGHKVIGLRYPGTQPVIPIPDSDRLTWVEGELNSFLCDASVFNASPSPSAIIPPPLIPPPSAEGPLAFSTALVHLAAYGVSPQPCTWENAIQINVLDSLSLMERAVALGIRKIVVCGSCVEYGTSSERYANIPADAPLEPIGPYAASKAAQSIAASALCREKGVELAILRLFTVFGEGQHPGNLWPSLKKAALSGEDFPMTPGEQIRDFIPVEQVAQAFLHALDLPSSSLASPLVANIGTGHPQMIRAFAEYWWKQWGATGKLLPGRLPYRDNEVMRYVPEIDERLKSET